MTVPDPQQRSYLACTFRLLASDALPLLPYPSHPNIPFVHVQARFRNVDEEFRRVMYQLEVNACNCMVH